MIVQTYIYHHSGFGIAGGLAIGKASASFKLQVNEDPMREPSFCDHGHDQSANFHISTGEVLSASLAKLDVNDVISFANTLTGLSIPQPPNFLDFELVKLYICPATTTIDNVTYPQGFSFQAATTLFGKHADIACAVASDQISIKGGVDNFVLGPLTVRGVNEPRATVDISISPKLQHILIDGSVTFFDRETDVHVEVQVMPSPIFTFKTVRIIILISLRDAGLTCTCVALDLHGAPCFRP